MQVRKLLLYACGSKEKYRELRDLHSLSSHVRRIREALDLNLQEQGAPAFVYDKLLTLIEHLKVSVLKAYTIRKNEPSYSIS